MLAVVLTQVQVIAENEYSGYEESGKDYLYGKAERVRLGLSSSISNCLMQRVLCMGGTPTAYLDQVDTILMRIVTILAEESKHPDDHKRGLLNTEPGLFIAGGAGSALKSGAPGPSSAGQGEKVPAGICPDWAHTGRCRFKDSFNGCAFTHPKKFAAGAGDKPNDRKDHGKQRRQDRRNDKKQNQDKDKDKNKDK
jgi:hypothetical protein